MKRVRVALALLTLLAAFPLGLAAAQPEGADLAQRVAALVRTNESSLPAPPVADAERTALAREVIEAGRVRELLSAQGTETAFEDLGSDPALKVSPQLLAAMRVVAAASFTPERTLAFLERRLAEILDGAALSAGLQWERSELGRRITALQVRGQAPEQVAAFRMFMRRFAKDGARDEARSRICAQADILSDSSQASLPVIEAVAVGSIVAIATEKSLPLDIDAIAPAIAAMRPMVRDMARQGGLAACLFYYRDLSDPEFDRWLDFLRTDTGGRYARGTSEALRDALLQRAEVFTRTLIEVARDLKKQPNA